MTSPSPAKIRLVNHCSPGDVLMMTAAIRDIHLTYPKQYLTAVDTWCPDVWQNNPWLSLFDQSDPEVLTVECHHPPLLDRCNGQPRHYVESIHDLLTRRLSRPIPLTRFAPELYISAQEQQEPPVGIVKPYWVLLAGGKRDLTIKWWPTQFYQRVVDQLCDEVQFVQVGNRNDHHPRLHRVISKVGQTTLRDLIHLIYHSQGVLCPITAAMHIAAAFDKPCVVVAGGREPPHWEMYPGHQYFHTIGQLPCCKHGGCWKARVEPLRDGDNDRDNNLCTDPVVAGDQRVAACMALIEPEEVCRAVRRYLKSNTLYGSSLSDLTAPTKIAETIAGTPAYPGGFDGRGIVIPAGGVRYFTCAWVCINMLRSLGCSLPIEVWHLGPSEMSEEMRGLLAPLGVTCVDAFQMRNHHPARILNGWELKPYAIIHSRFKEVLLLDADNVPVRDPTYLFDTPQFHETGAIFWPDFGRLGPDRAVWRLAGVAYRDEPEFESGQIVVHKQRCWGPLSLTMWMNEHSDFWYHHVHGDKDTFHMAWRRLDAPYSMPTKGIFPLRHVMCQHDFDGRRLFQHRNTDKWQLHGGLQEVVGFELEAECLNYLAQLRQRWPQVSDRFYVDQFASDQERSLARHLCQHRWNYRRIGFDERPMSFSLDGLVVSGSADCERSWTLRHEGDAVLLSIHGSERQTALLSPVDSTRWSGKWIVHEQMPVELILTGNGNSYRNS